MIGTLETLTQERPEARVDVFGASLSRRGFVAAGGALLASFGLVRSASAQEETPTSRGVPTGKVSSESFIEVHADKTILIRTGKSDFGQSTVFTALPPDRGR